MSKAHRKVALVGRASLWRERAVAHLRSQRIPVAFFDEVDSAVAAVKVDESITCVVMADDVPHEPWIAGVARMFMARPNLEVIVLGSEFDQDVMVQYLQLGRSDTGRSLVRYFLNDYDYERLSHIILDTHCVKAGVS